MSKKEKIHYKTKCIRRGIFFDVENRSRKICDGCKK